MGGGTYVIRRATYRKSEARKRYEETLKTRASVVVSRLCPQSCLAAEPEGDLALVTSRWSPSCHSCSHFSLWVCGPQQETEAPWEQGGPAPAAGMGRGAEKERGRKRHDGRRDREPRTPALLSWCPPQPCGGGREKDTVSWALSYVVLLRGTVAQVCLRQTANTEHRQISLAGALLPGPALPASHCSHLGPRTSLRGRILCAAALQQHPWPPRIPCPPVRVTPSPLLSVP